MDSNFFRLFIIALFLNKYVIGRTVIFKLISFGSKNYVQIVNENRYKLSIFGEDELLYTTSVPNLPDDEFQYYYIVDGTKENFTRSFGQNINSTYNEFFGRKDTIKPLKSFQHPPSLKKWNRSIGKTELFDDSYIPTLHITGNNVEKFFHNPKKYSHSTLEHVKFYLRDSVESFTKVSATSKNRNFSRFQFQLTLNENERTKERGIHGRYNFKLRTGGEDPLNLRQLIYGNIIQAIGMPSLHSIMVRVYYNKKPVGFYTLQESVISDSFIKNEFYGDPKSGTIHPPPSLGIVLDGTTGSDFEYHPENPDYYAVFDIVNSGENRDRLVAFSKALDELHPENESSLSQFENQWFDIDTFHKAMAMEYLTGDWDGYWYTTSNFAIYDDPNESTDSTFKFYFITQDHDETFGVGLVDDINTVGKKFPEQSYTTMINRHWHIVDDDAEYRTLVDKLISSTPTLQKRFESILTDIVQTIFNPTAFREVVDTYYERYEPEVKWDYSFTRPYTVKNQNPNFGYTDFLNNFESPIDGVDWGLYEWVELRAESIKHEFCITWKGDTSPPTNCNNKLNDHINKSSSQLSSTSTMINIYPTTNTINNTPTVTSDITSTFTDINYTFKSTKTSTSTKSIIKPSPTIVISTNGKCGYKNNNTFCPKNKCCSKYGYCGNGRSYCGKGCQSEFGRCSSSSSTGYNSTTHKKVSTRRKTKTKKTVTKKSSLISINGKCGPKNNNTICPNNKCCSKYGYCGTSSSYCSKGCQSNFGFCF